MPNGQVPYLLRSQQAQSMDAQQCLDILSQRQPHLHSGDGVCEGKHTHEDLKLCGHDHQGAALRVGQVINLDAAAATAAEGGAAGAPEATTMAAELDSMTSAEIITAFQQAQSERVRAYARFNSYLKCMLEQQSADDRTGSGCAAYPALCAEMTAIFAALSSGVRLMRAALHSKGQAGAAAIVDTVQKHEAQKLMATSALHLEQMRVGTDLWGEGAAAADATTAGLLHKGVAELKAQVRALEGSISEAMEELRYELEE
jgi:DNA repair REX1-B